MISQNETTSHRFLFNFSAYRYQGNKCYTINYVDLKTEFDSDGSDTEGSIKGGKLTGRSKICKDNKIENLNNLNEITADDKDLMVMNILEYPTITLNNKSFRNVAELYKQEISDYSKIFGIKKEDASIYF
jgi:hypothetical protein